MPDTNIEKFFFETLDNIEDFSSEFMKTNFEEESFCIDLKYSRQNFIKDVEKLLANVSKEKKEEYTKAFGFVLEKNENFTTIIGYPTIHNIYNSNDTILVKLFELIKNFTVLNQAVIKNKIELTKNINTIINTLPEFLTIIGKIQHRTHHFTVDVHTLRVLQETMKNELYKSFPYQDRKSLQIAILMHDFTKKEGKIDKTHPTCGARDSIKILKRFKIEEKQKEQITRLIKNHDWSERYNKEITPKEEIAKELSHGCDFLMLCVMAEADLKSVQKFGIFYENYKEAIERGKKEIYEIISIKRTGSFT